MNDLIIHSAYFRSLCSAALNNNLLSLYNFHGSCHGDYRSCLGYDLCCPRDLYHDLYHSYKSYHGLDCNHGDHCIHLACNKIKEIYFKKLLISERINKDYYMII